MSEREARCEVVLKNLLGLHVRPARAFMELAQRFESEVFVTSGETEVNGKSILGLTTLGAECGALLIIRCVGADADEAAADLAAFLEQIPESFGEERVEPA